MSSTRPLRARLGAVVAVLACWALVAGCGPNADQQRVIDLVNSSRAGAGLAPLGPNEVVRLHAQNWAEHLASVGSLSHSFSSTIPAHFPACTVAAGENVGVGPSIEAVHNGYLGSKGHRDNIMSRSFQYIGTGVARAADSRVFTVQVFLTCR